MTIVRSLSIAVVLLAVAAPTRAQEAPLVQLSSRLGVGGGAELDGAGRSHALFDLHLRTDALFGARTIDVFRIGIALDLRTRGFATGEIAGGLVLSFPVARELPLVLTAGAGYAGRGDRRSGALLFAELEWGLRPYNHHSIYAYAVNVFIQVRTDATDPRIVEVFGGAAIDLEFLFVIPTMFIVRALSGGDPDEMRAR